MTLAPCPFCGGSACCAPRGGGEHSVSCDRCAADGPWRGTPKEAASAWNTSHPTLAPTALAYLEALHAHATSGTANDPTGAKGGTAMAVHRAYEAHRQAGFPVYANNPETR